MDTTTLTNGAGARDPLAKTDSLVEIALGGMAGIGSGEIATAQKAVAIIMAARPQAPDADGRRIVADLADLMVRAALKGEHADVLSDALERTALFDAGHVAHAAWMAADREARQHLARTVTGNAALCWAAWSLAAKRIGAEYVETLGGKPRPDPETALRQGGKAAGRLLALEELTSQYEAVAAAWRAMRLLIGSGRDVGCFELPARFDRLPAHVSWDQVGMETRGQGLSVLDVAVRYGLADALVFDSRQACDERAIVQLAELKSGNRALAGVTRIATADMQGDDSRLVRVGLAEGHGLR